MPSKIFGATSLTGGGDGALDKILVIGSDYTLANGMAAKASLYNEGTYDNGDYNYVVVGSLDAEDPPFVIKPDELTAGVPYTGNLRWHLQAKTMTGSLHIRQPVDSYLGGIELQTTGTESAFIFRDSDANDALIFRNNDIDTLAIENGNVGIGTTTPTAKLEVNGGITETGGVLKENLLTNSGFGVWSNSTLENVGSDLVINGGFDSDTSGWTVVKDSILTSIAGGQSGNGLNIEKTITSNPGARQILNVVPGKSYKVSWYVKQGTTTEYYIYLGSTLGNQDLYNSGNLTATAGWVQGSKVIEATTTILSVTLFVATTVTTEDINFDTVTVYEVTPGTVAANTLGPDGWYKDSTIDLHREHTGTNTKDGSFYSLKMSPSNTSDYVQFPKDVLNDAEWVEKFTGRTVTFGVWVKTSTASHIRLLIGDGVTGTYSSYHSGGGSFEWLEVTKTNSTSATQFQCTVWAEQSSGIAYISQPMLVFGSSIGEGNYSSPPGEWIYGEEQYTLASFNNIAFSTVGSTTTIDLEAESNGRIPTGAKAVLVFAQAKDSDASVGSPSLQIRGKIDTAYTIIQLANALTGADDIWQYKTGVIVCDTNGDISYRCAASGIDTLDILIKILGVMV